MITLDLIAHLSEPMLSGRIMDRRDRPLRVDERPFNLNGRRVNLG
jgi:hypothetical protein